jgi:hypothetical protein
LPVAAAAPLAASAAAAADAFDDAFSASGDLDGLSAPLVDRFSPPVAAIGGSPVAVAATAQPFGSDQNGLRLPCDSPGTGCRTVLAASNGGGNLTPPPNPPFVPGPPVRPVPTPPNPPFVPGPPARPLPPGVGVP